MGDCKDCKHYNIGAVCIGCRIVKWNGEGNYACKGKDFIPKETKDTIYFRDLLLDKDNVCTDYLVWLFDNCHHGVGWHQCIRNMDKKSMYIIDGYDTISLLNHIKQHAPERYDTIYKYMEDNGYKVEDKTEREKEIETLEKRLAELKGEDKTCNTCARDCFRKIAVPWSPACGEWKPK